MTPHTLILFFLALVGLGARQPAYVSQLSRIISFYEVLSSSNEPTIADSDYLFGSSDESETEMILKRNFPSVKNPNQDTAVVEFVNQRLNHPDQYPSEFLKCLKTARPELFGARSKPRSVEFPPQERERGMRRFRVSSGRESVVFTFSQDEATIETVYLPDGKPISSLMKQCLQSR